MTFTSSTVSLGLLPATPAKPRLKLAPFLKSRIAVTPPANVDYISRITQWDMLGNDSIGDCGPISVANSIRAAGMYGDGTSHRFTLQEVLDLYARTSGYDPVTHANDNGVVLQELLEQARKGGVGPNKVLAFAEVNVADVSEVKAAIDTFGHVLIGANLPTDASDQLDRGLDWYPTAGKGGIPGSWGGHAVFVGAYNETGLTCVTWGQTQRMTWEWWTRYVGEAWVIVPEGEWFNAQGVTPTGLDLYGLGAELAELTGGTNPFPAPVTPPTVVPTPVPAPVTPIPVEPPVAPAKPVVDDADAALWLRVAGWAKSRRTGANKDAQNAVKAWASSKGLT